MFNYQTNDPKGWCGDASRGAALGRRTIQGELGEGETLMVTRKILEGDYDENGTYFGGGSGTQPLFWVSSSEGSVDYMIRAENLKDARAQVSQKYPDVKIEGDKYEVSLDEAALQDLLDMERESQGLEWTEVDDGIRAAGKAFEAAVLKTLEGVVIIRPEWFVDSTSAVYEMSHLRGGAGFLYWMEMEGHGISTRDGEWDHLVTDKEVLQTISKVVREALYKEYNALRAAFENVKDNE